MQLFYFEANFKWPDLIDNEKIIMCSPDSETVSAG